VALYRAYCVIVTRTNNQLFTHMFIDQQRHHSEHAVNLIRSSSNADVPAAPGSEINVGGRNISDQRLTNVKGRALYGRGV